MKTNIYGLNGKKGKTIEIPEFFLQKVREDIIFKILESKKIKQPYGPSPVAGKQHSASGIIKHHRKVWKSGYGRGMSRIPRKIMSRRGSQFNWEGAEVPNAVGGKRAHPPKPLSMINTNRINKKELRIALISSLSASANSTIISKKYSTLKDEKIDNLPFVIESGIVSAKTKDILSGIKKILGEKIYDVAIPKKSVRSGRGKSRGRKYKKNAGLLLVIGEEEKMKSKRFDISNANKVGVSELSKGGPGRIVIYTEKAIEDINKKLKRKNKK